MGDKTVTEEIEAQKEPKTIASDTPATKGRQQNSRAANLIIIILVGITVALTIIFLPGLLTHPQNPDITAFLYLPLIIAIILITIAIIMAARRNKRK